MSISITPTLVSEEEVRAFIVPHLESTDMSSVAVCLYITATEDYVKKKYYANSSLPDDAKIPILLLVASKIMRTPYIANQDTYSIVQRIGDVTFDTAVRGKSPFQQASSFEDWAHQMLKQLRSSERYKIDRIEY
jgi:hypothetical protein